ncbi:MAG: hypothetical protein L0Z50_33670 [Verrucomicrobiales bacterium]|nr:hypothetical protein [Verrucomicrobiales bacterium]
MKALILLTALFPPPEYNAPDRYGPPYYYYGPYDDRYKISTHTTTTIATNPSNQWSKTMTMNPAEKRAEKWAIRSMAAWRDGTWKPTGAMHDRLRDVQFSMLDAAYEMALVDGPAISKNEWYEQAGEDPESGDAWEDPSETLEVHRGEPVIAPDVLVYRLTLGLGGKAYSLAREFFEAEAEEEERRAGG